MHDWVFQVKTGSGLYKDVRVNNYGNYNDAERAALEISGAERVTGWNQVSKERVENTVVYNYYEQPEYEEYDDEHYKKLDKMEEEMYDLMCRIAMENDEELPTIQEFYDYLGK